MTNRRIFTAASIATVAIAASMAGLSGSSGGFREALLVTVPVWCTALAAAVPLQSGLYNLGAEGQFYVGATAAATGLAVFDANGAGGALAAAGSLALASLAGGLLGLLAGLARARLQMSEAVVTIMLNFPAIALARFVSAGPLRDPHSFGYPWTSPVPPGTRLGVLTVPVPGLPPIPAGLVITTSAAGAVWLLVYRTRAGLELRAVGSNPRAAAFAGVDVGRRLSQAMAVGGMLAGVGGGLELVGHQFRLSPFFSPGLGFTGLVAAVVSQSAGALLAVTAFLLAALRTALQTAERLVGVPSSVAYIIQGMLLAAASMAAGAVLGSPHRRFGRRHLSKSSKPSRP